MVDTVINYLDKFGPELLVIQFGFLVILSTMFLWLWLVNRKKYHNYKHAIPANVVKNYLDSIIQNSNALKSSLFRGGGMDVGNVPSVIPLNNLSGGDSLGLSGAPSTALLEEVNQKKAHISSMEAQLLALQTSQREMEARMASSASMARVAESKIKELEALLAKARDGGGDAALKDELAMISRERDEMREKLKEFEIISDDLANLKRLQQENDQLKRSLAASQGGALPVVENNQQEETESLVAQINDEAQLAGVADESDQILTENEPRASSDGIPEELKDETPVVQPTEQLAAALDAAPEKSSPEDKKPEKTPEDLLSEFEKMLG